MCRRWRSVADSEEAFKSGLVAASPSTKRKEDMAPGRNAIQDQVDGWALSMHLCSAWCIRCYDPPGVGGICEVRNAETIEQDFVPRARRLLCPACLAPHSPTTRAMSLLCGNRWLKYLELEIGIEVVLPGKCRGSYSRYSSATKQALCNTHPEACATPPVCFAWQAFAGWFGHAHCRPRPSRQQFGWLGGCTKVSKAASWPQNAPIRSNPDAGGFAADPTTDFGRHVSTRAEHSDTYIQNLPVRSIRDRNKRDTALSAR